METRRRVARGNAGVLTRRDATAVVINVVVSCGPVLILWIRFGAIASCFLGLLTYETTQNANASVVATGIMAIIPAHIMRSVGGGYDNESFAITAMLATCVFGADRRLSRETPPPRLPVSHARCWKRRAGRLERALHLLPALTRAAVGRAR